MEIIQKYYQLKIKKILKIDLSFIFTKTSFKDMPMHLINNILEVQKDNIYLYRLDNVIYLLKKKKIF